MYIDLNKTLAAIGRCLQPEGETTPKQLRRMYELTYRLQSQVLAVIYDMEHFGGPAWQEQQAIAQAHSHGDNVERILTLTLDEPLPAMKRLTEAVEEHWKALLHEAISEAAAQGPLPFFEKAFVAIRIVTPRGSDNARVWDTSNRAIQIILNNLKGVFFHDDDMEHMAFSVTGEWGETGSTTIRILDFERVKSLWGLSDFLKKGAKPWAFENAMEDRFLRPTN